ncbi:MAG: hypothetical protein JWO36_3911 [Myxococcales bacterium]|nr:hypothetical protein [Myxococcales bacterium]
MRDIVFDTRTNKSFIRGRDGREHTFDAVSEAERRAADGDAQAIALLESLNVYPDPTSLDPREVMKQILHDCPECRAAMAAGEQPIFGSGSDLANLLSRDGKRSFRDRSTARRWRKRKQGQ